MDTVWVQRIDIHRERRRPQNHFFEEAEVMQLQRDVVSHGPHRLCDSPGKTSTLYKVRCLSINLEATKATAKIGVRYGGNPKRTICCEDGRSTRFAEIP